MEGHKARHERGRRQGELMPERKNKIDPPPRVFLQKPLAIGAVAHTPHPGWRNVRCRSWRKPIWTFSVFLFYHFFLYFTTILHDGLKKITPDEDIPPKPICEERLKKICTQERSSARRGCCKKIVAEKRYSAWRGWFCFHLYRIISTKHLTGEIFSIYSFIFIFCNILTMKNWIKSLFIGDESPMKTIMWLAIICSVILHILNAPEWCYIILVLCTVVLHIIVTSD